MFTLILGIIFGLLFAFFATQNTAGVTLTIGSLALTNIPLYLIALGSLLIGFLISGLFNLIESVSSSLALMGKDSKIRHTENQVEEMSRKVQELEIENARLKGEHEVVVEDQSPAEKKNIFGKLRHNFSF